MLDGGKVGGLAVLLSIRCCLNSSSSESRVARIVAGFHAIQSSDSLRLAADSTALTRLRGSAAGKDLAKVDRAGCRKPKRIGFPPQISGITWYAPSDNTPWPLTGSNG